VCPPNLEARLSAEQRGWVEAFAPRVSVIARGLRRSIGLPCDELESAGFEALARAALRYDPATGTPFAAYAYYRVRGAMLDAARNAFPDHRRARRVLHLIEVKEELAAARLRPPDDPRNLHERALEAEALAQEVTAATLLSQIFGGEDDVDPDLRLALAGAVARLTDDERAMIDAIYVHGTSLSEHAGALGTSVSTVSRRHQRLLRRLGDMLSGRPPAVEEGP
jgi:RNA polymerase sigma factor for flagellar operon FliA